jgi:serine/threonine-protein kinase
MAAIETLGKYEIRREIGHGAMGVVYEGYDPSIKRIVALKTMRTAQVADEDPAAAIARFRREAQAAGRLNHPGIVAIYDFGEDAGTSYIAMEFVRGRELKECFDSNERFRIPDVVRIMSQILGALDYSHRQGVVHRDVKPANIFLLDDGTVKVADFGIAHIESSSLTQVGTVLGTPSYMSPEQIQGLPVDGRSDLFSAGVILYQFLTGERPFAGSASTTMQKVLKEEPLPPSTLNVQLPPALDAVVRKALAKRADERFQTGREFAEAIAAAAGAAAAPGGSAEATIIAAPDGTTPRAAPPDAPPAVPPGATADAAAKTSRTSSIAVVVAAAVVAAGALAWLVLPRSATEGTKPAPVAVPATSTTPAAGSAAPGAAPAAADGPASASTAPPPAAGTLMIAAVGLIDPSDPRYQNDKSLLQSDLRADSRAQLVEKAVGFMVDQRSLAGHYDLVRERLLSRSGSFVRTVVREGEPRLGKDGLMSITTEAIVDVKAVQKSLNEMSRAERVELIRASGDPKISVRIAVRDADRPDAVAQPSAAAENILKERIRALGFRTWAEGEVPGASQTADFAVVGEARIRKLSTRLAASGVTVTKYALVAWTVKCVDRDTGEEIYYNTTLPKEAGSWASEELALKAIGTRVADEFSRDFFLRHVRVTTRKVTLGVEGLPDAALADALARELVGLPDVVAATSRAAAKPGTYDLQLAGTAAAADLVATSVLKPLNAKLGQACFALGATNGDEVKVGFDPRCTDPAILSRFESNPPAGLYGAPPGRQKSVIRNPDTLRKLAI